jgi:hypothetical protein
VGNISRAQWRQPTSWAEVKKRAAGRYRHNALRRFQAQLRRKEVLNLLHRWGWGAGIQSQIAAHLGVHKSTICRDLKVIMPLLDACPACGQLKPREWWTE